jgi:antitoxin ParD1/3/4
MDEQDRLRAAKLEQLRDDVRHGLESGTSQPWSAEDAKRQGRARRERKLA